MSKSVFCNSFATLAGGVEALQEEHELEAASDGSPSETGAERPVRRQPYIPNHLRNLNQA